MKRLLGFIGVLVLTLAPSALAGEKFLVHSNAHEVGQTIEELAKSHPDAFKRYSGGAISLFETAFLIEVSPEFKAKAFSELKKAATDDIRFTSYEGLLAHTPDLEVLSTRGVYRLNVDFVTVYNLIASDKYWRLVKHFEEEISLNSKGMRDRTTAHFLAKKEILKPRYRKELERLSAQVKRVLAELDRRDTIESRDLVLVSLPYADYAGLEFITENPERHEKYFHLWLSKLTASVDETLEAYEKGITDNDSEWTRFISFGAYYNIYGNQNSLTRNRLKQNDKLFSDRNIAEGLSMLSIGNKETQALLVKEFQEFLLAIEPKVGKIISLHNTEQESERFAQYLTGHLFIDRVIETLGYSPDTTPHKTLNHEQRGIHAVAILKHLLAHANTPELFRTALDAAMNLTKNVAQDRASERHSPEFLAKLAGLSFEAQSHLMEGLRNASTEEYKKCEKYLLPPSKPQIGR
jgi:hypothetical protein